MPTTSTALTADEAESNPLPISSYVALRKILKRAAPLVARSSIDTSVAFAVGKIIAGSGQNNFAANALISKSQAWIAVWFQAPIYIINAITGKYYGIENYVACGNAAKAGFAISLATAIPVLIVLPNMGSILYSTGEDENITSLMGQYFIPYLPAILCGSLTSASQQFAISIEEERAALVIDAIGQAAYLLLSYGLIEGNLGMPQWDLQGWATAQSVQATLTTLLYLLYFNREKFKKYQLFSNYNWESIKPYVKEILKLGWPVSVHMLFLQGSQFLNAILLGSMGKNPLIAYNTVSEYLALCAPPQVALEATNTNMISQEKGAGRYQDARKIGNINIITGIAWSLCFGVIMSTAAIPLAKLFIDDGVVESESYDIEAAFILASLGYLTDTLTASISGGLQGLQDTKSPMLIGIFVNLLLKIPAYLLIFYLASNWGLEGFLGAYAATTLIGVLMLGKQWQTRTANEDSFNNDNSSLNPFRLFLYDCPRRACANARRPAEEVNDYAALQ